MADERVTGWAGWAAFAGILLLLAGVFQAIAGLVALTNSGFYVIDERALLLFNFAGWGWVHLLLGVLLFAAGGSVLRGNVFGRTVGVILASLSAVANLVFLPAYPLWSIVILTVDVLVIYGLAVHGGELRLRR